MLNPERLRELAEAAELRATGLAQEIAAELMRPTTKRRRVDDDLNALLRLQVEVGRIARQMRHVVPSPTLRDRKPGFGRITTPQYLKLLRTRVSLWMKVIEATAECIAGHEWPLVPELRPRFDLGGVQQGLLNAAFTVAHRAVNPTPQAENADEHGCFPDIPLNVARFMAITHLAYRLLLARKHPGPVRFLDVGCGGGVKVAIASELFAEAVGMEYDPGYVEVAARTFKAMRTNRCSVFQADGLTYDGYADYDVIYFYQPMSDDDGLIALERQIVERARPGTILLAPYQLFAPRAKALNCALVHESVYVKDASAKEVAVLIAEAHRMGPHIVKPDKGVPAEAGWLTPLWLACEANGIRPD